MNDIRYALRTLRKNAGITVVAVLALALGIGANTAIFSVVNAVFLRALPYEDAGALVEIAEQMEGSPVPVSYPNYVDWRKQAGVFEDMASSVVAKATLSHAGPPERIPVGYVSSGFLSVLRVKPVLGRDLTPDDDKPGAAPVALLSYALWRSRFGGNASILRKSITIDRRGYVVIGVLPAGFRFYRKAEVFVPISDALVRMFLNERGNHNDNWVVARLKPGATVEQARAQMDTIAKRLEREHPDVNTGLGIRVLTLRERVSGGSRASVLMLLGAVAMVLLIACVNVANLLLARAADRRKEMALRAALGASRACVLRLLLAESILLGLAGGCAGLLLARWSFDGLIKLVPAALVAGGLAIDLRVLGFTLLVSILTGLLFGLAPAVDAARLDLSAAMRDGTRGTGVSSRSRLRDGLVVAEVAIALVLLAGAGLLMRTLSELMRVRPGFDAANLLRVEVSLPDSEEYSVVRMNAYFAALMERLENLPGVESAGGINMMALSGSSASAVFYRDDRPVPPRGQLPSADNRAASPGYFKTMRIPLLQGRMFTAADGRITDFRRERAMEWFGQHKFAVLINETMAQRFWPGENPLGKTLRFGFPEMKGPRLTIVGVVGDTRDRALDLRPAPTLYFSTYDFPYFSLNLLLRVRTDPAALAAPVRRAALELDANAVVTNASTVEQMVSDSVAGRRLNMLILGVFAGLALLLATVGIYGVMQYSVNQRRHEIGVRMALGAGTGQVMRMVIGRVMVLGGLGVMAGSALALVLTRLIASLLYGVKPADPATFIAVSALLLAVALGAGYFPARHATRVDPLTALRCE